MEKLIDEINQENRLLCGEVPLLCHQPSLSWNTKSTSSLLPLKIAAGLFCGNLVPDIFRKKIQDKMGRISITTRKVVF